MHKATGRLRIALKNYDLYLISLPGLLFLFLFSYAPMYGIVIAFKDYNINKGILGSSWAGMKHFTYLFSNSEFIRVIMNTLTLSLLHLTFGFAVPVLLALLLNEVRHRRFKSAAQTFMYLPHFLSWVVVTGIFIDLLSPSTGIVNQVISWLGFKPIFFMGSASMFRWVLVFTKSWKEAGFEAILYIAAITAIDQELYQAASVDGAGRLQKALHVTLPGISPTILVMLILKIGHIMNAGMEQVLMMYNPSVYSVSDIIDTFIYRVTFTNMEFSVTTAAGLFKSVVGCALLLVADKSARKLGGSGIF